MREALFSQDGWGCQHVNQDTNWEVPSSPEPVNKDPSGPPIWKPNINNGTDLWESNLRNGGQPPVQQAPKPSWGHTPSSNLGGTWGEDDDGVEGNSVWTGQSSNSTTSGANGGINATGVATGVVNSTSTQWGQNVVSVGVGVGLNSSGNTASSTAGSLPPVVTSGCGSGASNLSAPGTLGGSSSNVGNAGNGWGDPREIRPLPPGGPMDIRNLDPREPIALRGLGTTSGDPRDLRMIDPRDPIRGDPRGISGRLNGTSEMWGHHSQISHNQIANINKMVGPVVGASGANVVPSNIGPSGVGAVSSSMGGQWGGAQSVVGGPKEIVKQITGWEEPSPPPQRRNIPNYDDGTSLWGQQPRVAGGGAHWKDMAESMSRGHLMRSQTTGGISGNGNVPVGGNPNNQIPGVVGPQTRLTNSIGPGGVSNQHGKPDTGTMWVHSNNNTGGTGGRSTTAVTSWGDDSHNVGVASTVSGNNWVEDKSGNALAQITASSNSWSDSPSGGSGGWATKQNKLSGATGANSGWSNANAVGGNVNEGCDLSSDWQHGGIVNKTQQQQKISGINVGAGVGILNTDIIKQSKQYRILVENGFKKEDVERALATVNMNIEEAAEVLRANANSSLAIEGWRRHEESVGTYTEHSNSTNNGGFPQRYPVGSTQPSLAFPPNNLMNNMSNTSVTGSNNPNMTALQVQKYLGQGGPHNVVVGPQSVNTNVNASVAFCQGATSAGPGVNISSSANQPSGQHIRMLGQQIQMAIHSGFISSQILTQPLTQTTLNLLNQLLGNIKQLQTAQQSLSRGSNANPMAINVAIAKYKQQIQNLQNQINAQQAVYIKQQSAQQQQQHQSGHLNNSGNDYIRNHEAIATLQGNFSEIGLNKPTAYQSAPNQQSRLNQWKLPVLEKDSMATDSTDFSRAPGAAKQNLSNNSNNMGSLGLQNDGSTWSTGRNVGDGWPDPSTDSENKDWSVAPTAAVYTDLVQEFEPGKPWKGSQIKSIEDDPSITPGSVARSPLSINPTPKDADIFVNTGKSSPTDLPPLSLSSSTWSFNPNQNFPSWSDNTQQCATSELWTSPLSKSSSRGPPPGLSTNKSGGVAVTTSSSAATAGNSNGWVPNRGAPNTNTTWSGSNASWNSSWLLLKNLNAQIDGPTLRTLCMQHGPLVSFHEYLNQGIALCKYATREEANKAQLALNNCVLGSTTIYVESPNENEVQGILQHLPQASSSVNSTISSSGGIGGNGNSVGTSGANVNTTPVGNAGKGNGNSGQTGVPTVGVGASGSTSNITSVNTTVASIVSTGSTSVSSNHNNGGSINNSNVNLSVNSGVSSVNTNGGNNSVKNSLSVGMTGGQNNISNVTDVPSNNSTWRQSSQNQALQGQNRPVGREADYEFISQFVCSIVDD